MTYCVDKLADVAQALLDCALIALGDCDDMVCRSFISTANGGPAWDECCACTDGEGSLWVALRRVAPVNTTAPTPCGWEYEATFEIGILRCAVVMNDDGSPPSEDALTAEALRVMRDAAIIRSATTCCFAAELGDESDAFRIIEWTPLGPDGGCVGGLTSLTVRFADCRCQETP